MKHWWHYLLLGLFAWLIFMVWRLPAHVAYSMVAPSQQLPVKLGGLHGTVWQGDGLLQYQGGLVANSSWELSPWALVVGKVAAAVSLQQADGYLNAELEAPISGGELQLSEVKGTVPLPLLQHYLTMIPVPLQGEVSLKLDELSLSGDGRPQGAEGRVVWHRAGVQLAESLPLGDLQMLLSNRGGGGIEGKISDSGGPLRILATLTLEPSGSLHLKGRVKSAESATPALRNALAMLGKADSEGFYPLNFTL